MYGYDPSVNNFLQTCSSSTSSTTNNQTLIPTNSDEFLAANNNNYDNDAVTANDPTSDMTLYAFQYNHQHQHQQMDPLCPPSSSTSLDYCQMSSFSITI